MARGFAEISRAAQAEDTRRARHAAALARRAEASSRRSAGRFGAGAVRGAGAGIRNVIGIGGGALALAGGFGAVNAIQDQMATQAAASRLANQAGRPEIKGQLVQEAQQVRGATPGEALAGMEEFVTKTGDLETARKIIGDLNTLALATGTNLGDLGATAGQAFNVLKDQISDPKQQLIELNSIMGVLAQQGAMGAVEIRDLAQDFGKLGAATRGFEGTAPDLLRTMGAFAQIAVARGGAESSADASTAASRLVNDIVVNRKKFRGLGVGIKSKSDPTKLRDPMAIMADVLEKTGGDVTKTAGLFGMESQKIFKGLGATFSEAEKKKKGSGRAAVMAEFQRFAGANVAPEEIQKRAASRLSDPDLMMQEATKKFNIAVSNKLMPVVTDQLVPALAKLAPHAARAAELVAKLADAAATHPWSAVAIAISASITKEIAAAKIGEIIANLLRGGGNVPPPIPGVVGAPGGAPKPGKAAAAATGGLALLGIAGAVASVGAIALEFLPDSQKEKISKEQFAKATRVDSPADQIRKNVVPGGAPVAGTAPASPAGGSKVAESADVTAQKIAALGAEADKTTQKLAAVQVAAGTAPNRTDPISKR